jgi:hypothetical protein
MMPIRHAAVTEVQRAAEADAVGALGEIVLPPGTHQLQVGEHQLPAFGELRAQVRGIQWLRGRMVEAFNLHRGGKLGSAVVVDDADEQPHTVGLDLQPVACSRRQLRD